MSIIIKDDTQNSYKYISGMAFNGIPRYKVGEDDIRAGQFYVVNKEGQPEEVDFLIYFYDNVQLYLIKFFSGARGYYKFYGTTIPSGSKINISKNFDENDITSLTKKENLLVSVTSNSDSTQGVLGEFIIEQFFKEDEGQLAIWLSCELESFSHVDFTYTMEPIDIEMPAGHFIYLTADLAAYNSDPVLEIVSTIVNGGKCPRDCKTVYLGKLYPYLCNTCEGTGILDGEECPTCLGKRIEQEQYEILHGTYDAYRTPTLPEDTTALAEFKIYANYENKPAQYICWGFTEQEDGAITASSFMYTDPANVCLSGDTLITLADGRTKRLDALAEQEEVMAVNGQATKISVLRRGNYSNYHTKYYFENDIVIDETYHHYFYNTTQGLFLALEDWEVGDSAETQFGTSVKLLCKERIEEEIERFGIWTEEGTYYANGLLSGTPEYNQKFLEDADAEQIIKIFSSVQEEYLENFLESVI